MDQYTHIEHLAQERAFLSRQIAQLEMLTEMLAAGSKNAPRQTEIILAETRKRRAAV